MRYPWELGVCAYVTVHREVVRSFVLLFSVVEGRKKIELGE